MKALKIFFKEVVETKSFIVDPHTYHKRNEVLTLLKKLVQHFEYWRNKPSTLIELICTLD